MNLDSEAAQDGGQSELSHKEVMTIFAGLMTAVSLAALDQTVVATALPTISVEFNNITTISWVISAYLLTSTITLPLYGKLSDLFGRKPLFRFAISVFMLGSLACALSQDMNQLVGARTIQGIGAGGLMGLAQTIIGDTVPPRNRGRYQGYLGAVFVLSSAVGPLMGGFFIEVLDWRWVFLINLPLGAAALVIIQRKLSGHFAPRRTKLDFAGAALLTTCITLVLLMIVWGGQVHPWASPTILFLGTGALFSFLLFVIVETRAPEPVIPLSLFGDRTVTIVAIVSFVMGAVLFGLVNYLPLFLQFGLDRSAASSGAALLPLMASMLVSSIVSGRAITRWGRYRLFPIVGISWIIVGLYLISNMSSDTSSSVVAFNMVVMGSGFGFVLPVLTLAVQNAVPYEVLGTATSSAQFFRSIGATVGVATLGALLSFRLGSRVPAPSRNPASQETGSISALADQVSLVAGDTMAEAIAWIFALLIPIALIALVLTMFLKEIPLRTTVVDEASQLKRANNDRSPGASEDPVVPLQMPL